MCYGLGQSAPALPSLVLVGSMPAALVLPQDSGCFERGVRLPRVPAAPVTRTGSSGCGGPVHVHFCYLCGPILVCL